MILASRETVLQSDAHAYGRGTTVIHLSRTRDCQVLGVEYSGRQVGLADLVLDPNCLPEGWRGWLARVACVADARPAAAYAAMLEDAGFDAVTVELHPGALLMLIAELEARITWLDSIAGRGTDAAFAIRPGIWGEVRSRIGVGEISLCVDGGPPAGVRRLSSTR